VTDLSIRRAVSADIHGIIEMLADDELGRERENPSLPLDANDVDAFAAIDENRNQILAVAEYEGKLIDCLPAAYLHPRHITTRDVARPDRERSGCCYQSRQWFWAKDVRVGN